MKMLKTNSGGQKCPATGGLPCRTTRLPHVLLWAEHFITHHHCGNDIITVTMTSSLWPRVNVSRLQSLRSPVGLPAFQSSGISPTLLLIKGFNLLDPARVWEQNFTGLRPPIVGHNFKGIVWLHSGNSKKELPCAYGFQACIAY